MNTQLKDRVLAARKLAGLTQKELADRVGVSQTAIHKLESGRSQSSRRTVPIALSCGVDPIWLERGEGPMQRQVHPVSAEVREQVARFSRDDALVTRNPDSLRTIPLLSMTDAGRGPFSGKWPFPIEGGGQVCPLGWVASVVSVSEVAFAVRCSNDTMSGEFNEGDILVIDPRREVARGRHVLFLGRFGGETQLRQLVQDGPLQRLKAVNQRYPDLVWEEGMVWCGMVVSKLRHYD